MSTRVVIAEDTGPVQEALLMLLDGAEGISVVAVCDDAIQARAALKRAVPDVLLTDIRMPPTLEDEGLALAAELRRVAPEAGVLLLSAYCEPEYAVALLRSGWRASGYLLKDRLHSRERLINAIRAVAAGGCVLDQRVVGMLLSPATGRRHEALTEDERSIFAAVAGDTPLLEVADLLGLAPAAVEAGFESALAKLGAGTISRGATAKAPV